MSASNNSSPGFNRLTMISLAISVASLIGYLNVIARVSTTVFIVFTGGAFIAGLASLVLGLIARKQAVAAEGARRKLLATLSIVVAIGYMVSIGIILLNIAVYWMI